MDCLLWLIVLGQKINKSCVTKDDTLGTTPKLYIPITINTALTGIHNCFNEHVFFSLFCRNFQYCPNGPICPKTVKVQDSFEFSQCLGYLTLHQRDDNVVKKTWVSFIHINSSSCAFKSNKVTSDPVQK